MTVEIGKKFGARVFREAQQGYGYAYHKGFAEAKSDIFVTMDGDGTYPVEEIERLLNILEDEKLDFISACRFPLQNSQNMDVVSKFGNWVLTTVTEVLFRYRLKDSQSGMWVFRSNTLPKLVLESNGMPFSEEIKVEAIRRGLNFKEVHIPYYERYGEKKIKKFRDGMRNLIHLFRMKVRK